MPHFQFTAADFFFQQDDVLFYFQQFIIYGMLTVGLRILGEITIGSILSENNLPAVSLQFADDNAEKGGLSSTVNSYDSSFLVIF